MLTLVKPAFDDLRFREKLLADEITKDASFTFSKEWKVNDEKVTISVEKV